MKNDQPDGASLPGVASADQAALVIEDVSVDNRPSLVEVSELLAQENPDVPASALLDRLMRDVWLGRLAVHFARLPDDHWESLEHKVSDDDDVPTRKRFLVPKRLDELLGMFARAADFPSRNPAIEEISSFSMERQAAILSTWPTARYDPKRIFLRRLHLRAQDAVGWCLRRRLARPPVWQVGTRIDAEPVRRGAPAKWHWDSIIEAVASKLASAAEDWAKEAIIAALQNACQEANGQKAARATAQKYVEATRRRADALRHADAGNATNATN